MFRRTFASYYLLLSGIVTIDAWQGAVGPEDADDVSGASRLPDANANGLAPISDSAVKVAVVVGSPWWTCITLLPTLRIFAFSRVLPC